MLGMGNGISMPPSSETFYDLRSHTDLAFYFKNNTEVLVSQWKDQSGNGNHISQGNVEFQAGIGGGGLTFDGGEYHYNLTTPFGIGGSEPYTIFVVVNILNYDTGNSILSNVESEEGNQFITITDPTQVEIQQTSEVTVLNYGEENFNIDETMVLCITKTSGRLYTIYKNGVVLTTSTSTQNPHAASTGTFTANSIGVVGVEGTDPFAGHILEYGLYERLLSATEISSISSYLVNKLL